MAENVDKPSDIEFARAIVENIPTKSTHTFGVLGAAYLVSKAIKRANKNR